MDFLHTHSYLQNKYSPDNLTHSMQVVHIHNNLSSHLQCMCVLHVLYYKYLTGYIRTERIGRYTYIKESHLDTSCLP